MGRGWAGEGRGIEGEGLKQGERQGMVGWRTAYLSRSARASGPSRSISMGASGDGTQHIQSRRQIHPWMAQNIGRMDGLTPTLLSLQSPRPCSSGFLLIRLLGGLWHVKRTEQPRSGGSSTGLGLASALVGGQLEP